MSDRSLAVVTAGLTQPSSTRLLADRLAAATQDRLRESGVEASTTVLELREHAQGLVNHLLTGFPDEELGRAIDAVRSADGLIAVTPIFSASYSGLFKIFFDLVERDGLDGKPVLIGATGGTARHSLALEHASRPLFTYLGALVVPTAVFAAAEDWGEGEMPAESSLGERIERAAVELATAVVARRPAARVDPFVEPVPFEDLLRGGGGRAGG